MFTKREYRAYKTTLKVQVKCKYYYNITRAVNSGGSFSAPELTARVDVPDGRQNAAELTALVLQEW